MSNETFSNNKITLEKMEEQLMEAIAETSYQAYLQLKIILILLIIWCMLVRLNYIQKPI